MKKNEVTKIIINTDGDIKSEPASEEEIAHVNFLKDLKKKIENDPVNHPAHYTSGKYQVIDIIADQLGPEGLRGFCLGNTLKYICRAGKKDPDATIQDLEKARWYLDHYLSEVK